MTIADEIFEELSATARELVEADRALRDALATNRRLQKRIALLEGELFSKSLDMGEELHTLHRPDERNLDA